MHGLSKLVKQGIRQASAHTVRGLRDFVKAKTPASSLPFLDELQ